ncbi:MAG: hypothetical protein ABII76_09795, partial [Pseudomonadota bacterium]
MADERVLRAILRFGVDKQSLEQVRSGAMSVDQALQRVEQRMGRLREAGEKISSVGMRLAAFGAMISGPFILAARSYIQYAEKSERISREWLQSTERLQDVQVRIGRVAARELLPVLEKAADLAEQLADFAEKHPGAIGAAVQIGGALTLLGSLITAVGTLANSIGTLGQLLVPLLGKLGAGAGAGAAGAAGGIAGPVVGAVAAGVASNVVGEALAKWIEREATQRMGVEREELPAWLRAGTGALRGGVLGAGVELFGVSMEGSWPAVISRALKGIGDQAEATGEQATGAAGDMMEIVDAMQQMGPTLSGDVLEAFTAYLDDIDEAEQEYGEKRAATVERYGEMIAGLEAQYGAARAAIVRDFAKQQAQALADFQYNRMQVAR